MNPTQAKNGAFTTIDHPLASSDSQAHYLNDRGQIVGFVERGAGQAIDTREDAGRSGSVDDTWAPWLPLTSLWTASGYRS